MTLSYYGECLCTHYSLNSITLIELSQFVKTQLLLAYNRLKLSVEQKSVLAQVNSIISQPASTL